MIFLIFLQFLKFQVQCVPSEQKKNICSIRVFFVSPSDQSRFEFSPNHTIFQSTNLLGQTRNGEIHWNINCIHISIYSKNYRLKLKKNIWKD